MTNEKEILLEQKVAALEKLVAERTADLVVKNRELEIEVSLERVRARTMAMHHSNEFPETAAVLYQQLKELGFEFWASGIGIWDENDSSILRNWMNNGSTGGFISPILLPFKEDAGYRNIYDASLRGDSFIEQHLEGEDLKIHYNWLKSQPSAKLVFEKLEQSGLTPPSVQYKYAGLFKQGFLIMISAVPKPNLREIAIRFAKVFEQTYTRFLDLKKAEAQAREARIEAALEKVRSRSLAMHKSDELQEVVNSVFARLIELEIEMDTSSIIIPTENDKELAYWFTNTQGYLTGFTLPFFDNKIAKDILGGKEKGAELLSKKYSFTEKNDFWNYLFDHTDFKRLPEERKKFILDADCFTISVSFSKNTAIQVNRYYNKLFSASESEIVSRFARVFEQSYTRFLDLKKAEAQAREAKIEASLERVRGKAMAMHSSEDLTATINLFYQELELFSITPRRCGVGLLDKETHMAEVSTMNTTEQGQSIEVIGQMRMAGHPILEGIFENWLIQKEYHPVLRGNEIKEYYQLIRPQVAFPEYPNDAFQYGYFFYFAEGGIYAWTEKPLAEDELKIYRRFTTVFSLTYKRYKDLKDAEAREKEAVKQAALDRVRADIASMRSTADLDRITPLIWKELTILGIPFIRCGVFIMDDLQQLIHTFLSTPDGKAIAAFHLPYSTPGNIGNVISHWKAHKNYIDHWDENELYRFAEILVKQGALDSAENYLKTIPKGGFSLHFLPFLQGMLYVGNTSQLNDEQVKLIQHVADAFATAYARYEDFNKLEAAKQQVDRTLVELKQTQAQLIQSEKMASLGELTAGIAHEIQNPLNFVNNFSEVNGELISELVDEVDKGNKEEIKAIAGDIRQNLEKIHHHGKRADAIVKGMLAHSRQSTGKKELTDLNALAE